jgi:hypothetical protein
LKKGRWERRKGRRNGRGKEVTTDGIKERQRCEGRDGIEGRAVKEGRKEQNKRKEGRKGRREKERKVGRKEGGTYRGKEDEGRARKAGLWEDEERKEDT